MQKLIKDLKAVNKEVKALAKKAEKLAVAAGKLKKAKAAKKATAKKKAAPKKKAAKKKAARKTTARKTVAKKTAAKKAVKKKAAAATPTDNVLKVMKRYKKGVSVAKLKALTGYNDKQISNIVHRASKKGKIARVDRGVYKIA